MPPRSTSPVTAVLLSGCSGVGKSSVAYEIVHQLSDRDFPHVHIDGDNLDMIHPAEEGGELMLANLRTLWSNFYAMRGARNLLLSGTAMVLEHQSIRSVLEDVSGGEEVRVLGAILTAKDDTVAARLKQREIGTDLERHLASSKRMSKILGQFEGLKEVHRVSTDDKEVSQIADEVIRLTFKA